MNNEIVFTITQGKISIPLEFEINSDEINLIIGTSFNELFLFDKANREVPFTHIIKYNKVFNLKLEVNSEVIFDSSESQFDILRSHLKFNRSSKSRAALARIVYEAITQVLTKQFKPVEFQKLFLEGRTKSVSRNIYERNPKAREICIEFYGSTCLVCSLNFNDTYGDIGKGFIHVHHLVPISSVKKEYNLDPIRDLRPVCPNCHAMIHKRVPPFSINELKERLTRVNGNS